MSGKDELSYDELTNYGYDERINICMIGPSGVGKTSLLATMYKTLQRNLGKKFRFEPLNKEAFVILNAKYTSLQKMVDKPAYTRVVNTDKGTQDIQEYLFGLDCVANDGTKTKLILVNFFDTPGAMTSEMSEELEKRIQESEIIINAIDSGVMMKADYAEEYNGYAIVQRLLEENAFIDAKNKLVIFTLIKAETWISERENPKHTASDIGYFLRKFEEHCQCLIDLFPQSETASRLGIFCPVETLGCVEFSRVTKDEQGDELVHYKRVFGKKFSPRHVQLPLYFALRFALSGWCNKKGTISRWFSKIFGSYNEVLAALDEMDTEALQNMNTATIEPGFYGNPELLKVKNN